MEKGGGDDNRALSRVCRPLHRGADRGSLWLHLHALRLRVLSLGEITFPIFGSKGIGLAGAFFKKEKLPLYENGSYAKDH